MNSLKNKNSKQKNQKSIGLMPHENLYTYYNNLKPILSTKQQNFDATTENFM